MIECILINNINDQYWYFPKEKGFKVIGLTRLIIMVKEKLQ